MNNPITSECTACDASGVCGQCHGAETDAEAGPPSPCRECGGTGVCITCHGTGETKK